MFGNPTRRVFTRHLTAAALAGSLLVVPAVRAGQPLDSTPQTAESSGKWKKRWIASWIAVIAVNALDIHSSRGHIEANPLLRDRTGHFAPGKAMLFKLAVGGGFFGAQLFVTRSHPERNHYKPFTLANTVAAGALAGVVGRNYSLPAPQTIGAPASVPAVPAP